MKFLRILIITAILNVPCSHAMQEAIRTAGDSAITAVVVTTCLAGGFIYMHDGLQTARENKGTYLLPPVSKDLDDASGIYRKTVGGIEFCVGCVMVMGLLGTKE
jgi:hypothetical protein